MGRGRGRDAVDLAWSAVSGDLSDAARPRLTTGPEGTIPVYRYTAPEIVGTAGELRQAGGRTETIVLPGSHDAGTSRLDVRLDLSLAAAMTEGLSYLEHFEYECTEQVVSRFLPNVLTYRALRSLGTRGRTRRTASRRLVLEGLEKLYMRQNGDGGWGWWDGDSSNPYLTAYATYALLRLAEADFAVRSDVVDRALDYLQRTRSCRRRTSTPRGRPTARRGCSTSSRWPGDREPAGVYAERPVRRAGQAAALRQGIPGHDARTDLRRARPRVDTLLSDLVNEPILSRDRSPLGGGRLRLVGDEHRHAVDGRHARRHRAARPDESL